MNIDIPNGFEPRELGQKSAMRFFDSGGTRGVYCWPRRYGKDLTFAHQACKSAHMRRGMYLHMLPTHKQARKVLWDGFTNDGQRIMDQVFPREIVASRNETEMKIVLRCGSIWQLVGSDYYDSIVGANPIGLAMSEAALSDPRAWNYFRPMLAANGGWAAFNGTPRGYNWFYDLLKYAKGDLRWDWSHLTSYETQHIAADVLADERKQMPDELFRQEYLCDFSAANVGAVFGKYIERAEKDGRIVESLPFDPFSQIWITSDIGFRDKAAFWWWRILQGGFELIDFDEASGLDVSEWIPRLLDHGHKVNTFILPHDAKARTFQSKHTVAETLAKSGVAENVRVNAQRKKMDSINAGRMVMNRCRWDASKCQGGLDALRSYSFEYDEEQRCFSQEPKHDWSSHAADAFMEGAALLVEAVPAPAPPKQHEQVTQPLDRAFTLDRLWETVHNQARRRV